MAKVVQDIDAFRSARAWGAIELAEIEGATVRLHWTDKPYVWHKNDGAEAFVVLSGQVDMRFLADGQERVVTLGPSDIFVSDVGDEHVAEPIGEARILVIEKRGSI